MKKWILQTARVFRREFSLICHSAGVMIFFFVLPIAYPVVYSLIYNPEVTKKMPVAVIDNCRTAESREFVRHADATQAMDICGYASDKAEARRWWEEKKCFGVIEIPEDYSRRVTRGEQGVIQFYSDASLLLRYRTFLESLTTLQMATDTELRQKAIDLLGATGVVSQSSTVATESYFLGDTQQGFASFIMPGIVVLIIQQSLLLGITFLGGASNERRRLNGGVDPLQVPDASPLAEIVGKTLCYTAIYMPLVIYVLHYVLHMFSFPQAGSMLDGLLFIVPLLLSTCMLGLSCQFMMHEKESPFVVIVFSSVLFLFLSGLTWPRYAMSPLWVALGDFIPATWGVDGFIRINSNGGTLAQQATPYAWLWDLTLFYGITAWLGARYRATFRKRVSGPRAV